MVKNNDELYEEYEKRYNDAFSKTVIRPYCIPSHEKIRKMEKGFIDVDSIFVERGFKPFHHTKEEIITYAISIHDDEKKIEEDSQNAEGLCVDEYPGASYKKAYMISDNGNHRNLVYKCIGLSKIKATKIQRSSVNQWKYYCRDCTKNSWLLISWLYKNGLISRMNYDDYERSFYFESHYSIGWLLPEPCYSLVRMIKSMKERLSLIEVAFKNDENLSEITKKIHRSVMNIALSIKMTYYIRIIREQLGISKK